MVDREHLKNHLLLDYMLSEDEQLLQALVRNPAAVLERLGLTDEALRCPPAAHRASRRAEAAALEINRLGDRDILESLPQIAEIVSQHFDSPYRVEKIPFGVRFEESQKRDNQDGEGERQEEAYTGTATVACTWSPGCGFDVDG